MRGFEEKNVEVWIKELGVKWYQWGQILQFSCINQLPQLYLANLFPRLDFRSDSLVTFPFDWIDLQPCNYPISDFGPPIILLLVQKGLGN